MEKFSVKARAADKVAAFLATSKEPVDCVVSVGHALHPNAQALVRPFDSDEADPRPRHTMLKNADGLVVQETDLKGAMAAAIELDEQLTETLDHEPNMVLHCQEGRVRSLLCALAIYGGRQLRQDPHMPIGEVLNGLRDLLDDNNKLEDESAILAVNTREAEDNLELYLIKPLQNYQTRLRESPTQQPARPVATSGVPLVKQAQRP